MLIAVPLLLGLAGLIPALGPTTARRHAAPTMMVNLRPQRTGSLVAVSDSDEVCISCQG